MKAGQLRHRITIQSYTTTNTHGEITKTWSTFKTVWARIEPITGREWLESGIVEAEVTHRVTIRYLANVKPQMRIYYDSKYYDIMYIENTEMRDRQMILMCKENVI